MNDDDTRWTLRPRRTKESNFTYVLAEGNEDNDLWVCREAQDGELVVRSTWELSDEQREVIARGGTIDLLVWGGQPPVALAVGPPMEERRRGA
jgi:hypothetical protein